MDNYDNIEISNVNKVVIKKSRWKVHITIYSNDTYIKPIDLIATNDSFYTGGDGIWWDTVENTEEYFNENM